MYEQQQILLENTDRMHTRRASLWLCRLLIVMLYLSFVAFLAALWLSGTFGSAPTQLSLGLVTFMELHRWIVLALPTACLGLSYVVLRYLTGEIITVPERYLDERQKMVRDQAHRSAFKLMKASCLLIPIFLVLMNLHSWTQPASPTLDWTTRAVVPHVGDGIFKVMGTGAMQKAYTVQTLHQFIWVFIPSATPATSATSAELVLSGCLLLLCLFLIISALPMTILAWKGKS